MIQIVLFSLLAYFGVMYLLPMAFILVQPLSSYGDFGKFMGLFLILMCLLIVVYATRDARSADWVEAA